MDRNKETNYPNSCDNCPNNPDNYDLIPENIVINAAKKRVKAILEQEIEFTQKYIDEQGGGDGIASKEEWDDIEEEHY